MTRVRVLMTSVPDSDRVRALAAVRDPSTVVVTSERLSSALVAAHPDVEVLSCMVHDPVSFDLVSGWPRLRGVVTRSAGFDHIPVDDLAARGVDTCALGDYAVPSVVQHTLMSILSLLRRTPEAMAVTQGQRRGGTAAPSWDRSRLAGRNLADVTVGVLGTGRIGAGVVRALSALGGQVVGFDVVQDPALARVAGFRYVRPLGAFLAASDVLTVHVPLTRQTRRMVDRAALSRLPAGALLVNTARGAVVDQLAVLRALESGRLGGYAADVLPGEPKPPLLSRFQDFTNVQITPHLGAYDRFAIANRYRHNGAAITAFLKDGTSTLAAYRVDNPGQEDAS